MLFGGVELVVVAEPLVNRAVVIVVREPRGKVQKQLPGAREEFMLGARLL